MYCTVFPKYLCCEPQAASCCQSLTVACTPLQRPLRSSWPAQARNALLLWNRLCLTPSEPPAAQRSAGTLAAERAPERVLRAGLRAVHRRQRDHRAARA